MTRPDEPPRRSLTRARLLRAALGASAVVAGGTATAGWPGGGAPAAAPSESTDVKILNLFLLLEQVQEGFYEEAVRNGRLEEPLRTFARTVAVQETEHVAVLTDRLGGRARERPRSDYGDAVSDPERFQQAAIKLEESAIAAFISQGANLTRDALSAIVPLVSVEARQVAWVRDLAGVSPAPRAADPAREAQDVLDELRREGFIT
jgi:Ferritin-like domain